MSVIKEYSFQSVSGLGNVYVRCWLPDDLSTVKAVFQMAHGMAEHSQRYDWFADKLCQAGYAVFMNDHIGHGKSVSDDDNLGYFGDSDGWKHLVEDQRKLTELARGEFPDLPLLVFGHSMGSFVCRAYTAKYHDIDAAIYCGTGGPNPAAGAGIAVANMVGAIKGKKHRSKLIDKMAFGAYNKRFEGRTAFDWLSRDNQQVDKYIADKYCGYLFTVAAYKDLFSVLQYVSSDEAIAAISNDLPILLIAGADDPVGNYGLGVKTVYNKLLATGHTKAEIVLMKDCRHEIINEINRDEAAEQIIAFADKALSSKIAAAQKN